jgi:hypothetical protein
VAHCANWATTNAAYSPWAQRRARSVADALSQAVASPPTAFSAWDALHKRVQQENLPVRVSGGYGGIGEKRMIPAEHRPRSRHLAQLSKNSKGYSTI